VWLADPGSISFLDIRGRSDPVSAAEQYHHQPTRQDCLLDGSPGIAPRTGGRIGQTGLRWRDDLDLIDTHPPAG
jgi:hypothetical protein